MFALLRFVTLRHLRAKPLRTVTTTLGVALGVALFVAIGVINDATLAFFRENVGAACGSAALTVLGAESGFDEGVVAKVKAVPGVGAAVPAIETRVRAGTASLVVLGIDFLQESAVRSYKSGSGRVLDDPLEFLNLADSIVLTKSFAKERGIGIEAPIELATAHGVRRFVVRGLLEDDGAAKAHGGRVAIMDIDGARATFGKEGKVDRIDVVPEEGVDATILGARIAAAIGPGFRIEPRDAQAEALARMVKGYQAILAFLSSLALVVGMFLVASTMTVAVAERRREIGVLRALGATRVRVVGVFVIEAIVLGLVGALVGVGLGRLVAEHLVVYVSRSMSRQYVTPIDVTVVRLRAVHAVLGAAFGTAASALATLAPAWRASRIRGAEAFGDTTIEPVASAPSTRLFARWPIVRLAVDNLARHPRRTATNALALVVGLALVVVMGTIHESFRRSIGDWQERTFRADLLVSSSGRLVTLDVQPLAESVGDVIDRVPGVAIEQGHGARAVRVVHTTFEGRTLVLKALDPPHAKLGFSFLDAVDGSADAMGRDLYSGQDTVLVSESFARHFGRRTNDAVFLDTPSGRVPFRIGGVVIDFAHPDGVLVMSRAVYKRYWNDPLVTAFAVQVAEGASVEAVRDGIDAGDLGLVASMPKALRAELDATLDESFAYTRAVEAAAIGVGLLGMLSTLFMSFFERARELAMLRAVGMSRAQLVRLVLAEALVVGGASSSAAAVLGAVVARGWVVTRLAGALGWSIAVHVPASSVAWTLLCGLSVGMVAGVVVARRVARRPIREALA